jgi:hypothetical protein
MILFVFLAVTAGLGALIIEQMQSVSRAADLQAFQRLAITAQSFAGWPTVAEQVGKRSLPIINAAGERPATEIVHPQFGRLPLKYYWGDEAGCLDPDHAKQADHPSNPASAQNGAAAQKQHGSSVHFDPKGLIVWGETMTYDPQRGALVRDAVDVAAVSGRSAEGQTFPYTPQALANTQGEGRLVCFHFGPIPYRNTLTVPDGFQALLLFHDPNEKAANAGQLVAHVGADILPIRNASDIPDLERLLHRAAAQPRPGSNGSADIVTSVAGSVLSSASKSEFLTPLDATIAGRTYRLYVYPVSFSLGGVSQQMLVVGATLPPSSLVTANLNGSRFALFGLLLIGLLVLTPLIRIANLGPVDGVKPFDLAIIASSLVVGTAIAATIALLAVDTVKTKRHVDDGLRDHASLLANKIGTEIFDISTCRLGGVGFVMDRAAQIGTVGGHGGRPLVFKNVWKRDCQSEPLWAEIQDQGTPLERLESRIAHPDVVLFMDKDGLPAWTSTDGPAAIATYTERPGPFYALADRHYFSRANNRDVVAGTERLAARLTASLFPRRADGKAFLGLAKERLKPAANCSDSTCGIAIEQILSRGDGIAKTMISLPLAPCRAGNRVERLCKTGATAVAVGFVMKSMLAPALPDGMHYAVVDLSQRPDLPSIFHTDPERANAERFALSLDGTTLDRFNQSVRQEPSACDGAKRKPAATTFSGRYIGEDQRFAVALAPCSEWAVVTFMPDSLTDRQGALPAEIAFLAWLGLALPFSVLLMIGLLVARRASSVRFRMLWPDPLLDATYRKMAALVGLFIILSILAALGLGLLSVIALAMLLGGASHLRPFWPETREDQAVREIRTALSLLLVIAIVFFAVGVWGAHVSPGVRTGAGLFYTVATPTRFILLAIPFACTASLVFVLWNAMAARTELRPGRALRALRRLPVIGAWFSFGLGPDRVARSHQAALASRRMPVLNRRTEISYVFAIGMWLFASSALPVGLIAFDAYAYGLDREQAQFVQAQAVATRKLERALKLIYKSQYPDNADAPLPREALLAPPPALTSDTSNGGFTDDLLCLVGRQGCSLKHQPILGLESHGPKLAGAFVPGGPPARAGEGSYGIAFYVSWALLAIFASLLPAAMVRILCRSLFGFHVPLEAVRYPRIRPGPDRGYLHAAAAPDDPIWEVRYPDSTVAETLWTEADFETFAPLSRSLDKLASVSSDPDRTTLRIHASDWQGRAFALVKLLVRAKSYQCKLIAAQEDRLRQSLKLTRAPREADYFRIVLVLPNPASPGANGSAGEVECADKVTASPPPAWLNRLGFREEDAPPYDEEHAPWRAILVAGSDDFQRRLRDYAEERVIDLYETCTAAETPENKQNSFEMIKLSKLPVARPPDGKPYPLVIVHNLELLIRNDDARKRALKLLEDLVREQDRHLPGKSAQERRTFRLLLLADISPLDRFLQATEWRDAEEDAGQSNGPDDPAENIRWSRLLEDFTTYTGRVEPRIPIPLGKSQDETAPIRYDGVDYLLRELAYLPDRVVQALLPDHDDILHEAEIREWGHFLESSRPEAIADFLASQLIEHYHYLWSISSRAEQILIHRMASGELPIIRKAYALRSLVRRGIVVLDPAPRLMNHSFARFVGSVERPELLRRWKREAPKGGWTRIHGNLTVVLPILLLLGGVLVVRGVIGVEAALPIIAAASSALLKPLFSGRPAAT